MDKQWHVLYVKSRTENKVYQSLLGKGVEVYLPLQRKLRQWSDRKKIIEMPLFPGYIFVKVSCLEYENVLKAKNAVCYITFEGKAAIVPPKDINALKQILKQDQIHVELTTEELTLGQKVEIVAGPLLGIQGELLEIKGKRKVGIRIRQINYTVVVEVSIENIVVLY